MKTNTGENAKKSDCRVLTHKQEIYIVCFHVQAQGASWEKGGRMLRAGSQRGVLKDRAFQTWGVCCTPEHTAAETALIRPAEDKAT